MAKYTGTQSMLNAALGDYRAKGFSLTEPDDHTLFLFYEDERIAVFSAQGALIPSIHETCRSHLEKVGVS